MIAAIEGSSKYSEILALLIHEESMLTIQTTSSAWLRWASFTVQGRCWKPQMMCLSKGTCTIVQVDRYRAGIARMDFDAGLAPYNVNVYPAWKGLSQHISAQTIDRWHLYLYMKTHSDDFPEYPQLAILWSVKLAKSQTFPVTEAEETS